MTFIRIIDSDEEKNLVNIASVLENQWYVVHSGPAEWYIGKVGFCYMRDLHRGDGPRPVIILTDGNTISNKDYRFKNINTMTIKYEV